MPTAPVAPLAPEPGKGHLARSSRRPVPRVFLSHSSRDKEFVRTLANELTAAKVHVWLDERELGVGDSIVTGIPKTLNRRSCALPDAPVDSRATA
jgi:hypothetical protein